MNLKIRWISIFIVGVICAVIAAHSLYVRLKAADSLRSAARSWQTASVGLKTTPTSENLFLLQRDYEWLNAQKEEITRQLYKSVIPSGLKTPLQFKEELLTAQTKLTQLADIQGSKLDGTIGFSEYASGRLPEERDIAVLEKQLVITNEMVNIFLRQKVDEVALINRMGSGRSQDGFYNEMLFSFEVRCFYSDMLNVLSDMANAPYTLILRSLKIKGEGGGKVHAVLTVGALEFDIS